MQCSFFIFHYYSTRRLFDQYFTITEQFYFFPENHLLVIQLQNVQNISSIFFLSLTFIFNYNQFDLLNKFFFLLLYSQLFWIFFILNLEWHSVFSAIINDLDQCICSNSCFSFSFNFFINFSCFIFCKFKHSLGK